MNYLLALFMFGGDGVAGAGREALEGKEFIYHLLFLIFIGGWG